MAEPLWRLGEITRAVSGTSSAAPKTAITGISIDSRTLQAGDLFIAIRGRQNDGHQFIRNAFSAGASAVLIADNFEGDEDGDGAFIRVADTEAGLKALGQAARERATGSIVAITGSVGKTGTKEALKLALSASGNTHASEKSYNNQWGVPLSLARMAASADYGIFEIGMNHGGEIEPLSRMVRPDIAIITTVEPVHLEFFPSVDAIAEAKAEIFCGLSPGGVAILNCDNPYFPFLKRRAEEKGLNVMSFGLSDAADIRLLSVANGDQSCHVRADVSGIIMDYEIGAPGRHLALNSLASLGAMKAARADLEKGAHALKDWHALEGRGARSTVTFPEGAVTLIDESYNANPASMRAALLLLGETDRICYPRRLALLGDMRELGEKAGAFHAGLAQPIEEAGVDLVFACGEHMADLYNVLPNPLKGGYAKTSDGLWEPLKECVQPGDIMMIKGSLGSRMGILVNRLLDHLKDLKNRGVERPQ